VELPLFTYLVIRGTPHPVANPNQQIAQPQAKAMLEKLGARALESQRCKSEAFVNYHRLLNDDEAEFQKCMGPSVVDASAHTLDRCYRQRNDAHDESKRRYDDERDRCDKK
jgi:hypothetical protein